MRNLFSTYEEQTWEEEQCAEEQRDERTSPRCSGAQRELPSTRKRREQVEAEKMRPAWGAQRPQRQSAKARGLRGQARRRGSIVRARPESGD